MGSTLLPQKAGRCRRNFLSWQHTQPAAPSRWVRLFTKAKARLDLSRAKHRSLTGHARMARRIASLIPFYEYDERRFFRSDDAPEDIAAKRRAGFMRLASLYRQRFAKTSALTATPRPGSPTCSSPAPIACRSSTAASSASICRRGSFLASSVGRDGHRPGRQRLLRPDRILRRQSFRA